MQQPIQSAARGCLWISATPRDANLVKSAKNEKWWGGVTSL
jgi:hypothetical protein